MSEPNLDEIREKIVMARKHMESVQRGRVTLAGILGGAPGMVGSEVEFPDPDIAYVWQTIMGRRVGQPLVYRLSFGRTLKWVGISHPWGLPLADIVVTDRQDSLPGSQT
jgi:hypothetical protein